jgi:P-type E1-E2 ATPase
MIIQIPGSETLQIDNLVLDYNGTLAADGFLDEGVAERLGKLALSGLSLHVITADTNGTAASECSDLPVKVHIYPREVMADEKAKLIRQLGQNRSACIGNGKNDLLMVQEAILSIVVVGREGAYAKTAMAADLWVNHSLDALDLFLQRHRLIASLRS